MRCAKITFHSLFGVLIRFRKFLFSFLFICFWMTFVGWLTREKKRGWISVVPASTCFQAYNFVSVFQFILMSVQSFYFYTRRVYDGIKFGFLLPKMQENRKKYKSMEMVAVRDIFNRKWIKNLLNAQHHCIEWTLKTVRSHSRKRMKWYK